MKSHIVTSEQLNHMKQTQYLIYLISIFILLLSGCGDIGSSSPSGRYPYHGSSPENTGISVTLSWEAPVINQDGSPLTDLSGYIIYYGTSPGYYEKSVNVGNNREVMIDHLSSGSWCCAVTAYDYAGNESTYSTELCMTL